MYGDEGCTAPYDAAVARVLLACWSVGRFVDDWPTAGLIAALFGVSAGDLASHNWTLVATEQCDHGKVACKSCGKPADCGNCVLEPLL